MCLPLYCRLHCGSVHRVFLKPYASLHFAAYFCVCKLSTQQCVVCLKPFLYVFFLFIFPDDVQKYFFSFSLRERYSYWLFFKSSFQLLKKGYDKEQFLKLDSPPSCPRINIEKKKRTKTVDSKDKETRVNLCEILFYYI